MGDKIVCSMVWREHIRTWPPHASHTATEVFLTVPDPQLLQGAGKQIYGHFEPEKSTVIVINRGRESHRPRLGPS